MFDCDCSDMPFSDFKGNRPVLSVKTLNLRRVSQENHVRRMKFAHEKKKSQSSIRMSGFPPPLTPKKHSSIFRTPFTTPRDSQVGLGAVANLTGQSKCKKLSYNNISLNMKSEKKGSEQHGRFTPAKITKNVLEGAKEKLDSRLAVGDTPSKDLVQKCGSDGEEDSNACIVSGTESSPSANKVDKNVTRRHTMLSVVSDSTNNRQSNDQAESVTTLESLSPVSSKLSTGRSNLGKKKGRQSPLNSIDSLENFINEQETPAGGKQNRKLLLQNRQFSSSKIPISLTRLTRRDQRNNSSISETPASGQYGDNSGRMLPSSQEKSSMEWPSENSPLKQDGSVLEKKDAAFTIRARGINTITGNSFPRHPASVYFDAYNPVSTWLNSSVVGNEPGNSNSSNSRLSSHDGKTYSVSTRHPSLQESEKCLSCIDIIEDFGSEKGGHCKSVSGESAEFYDTLETEYGVYGRDSPDLMMHHRVTDETGSKEDDADENWTEMLQDDANENWTGMLEDDVDGGWSEDDHSTIIIPPDKDLELDAHRESMFRQLPDYPNTPYYLRYPRYHEKLDGTVLRSDGKEMSEALRILGVVRPKRDSNSTPRVRESCRGKLNFRAKARASQKEFE